MKLNEFIDMNGLIKYQYLYLHLTEETFKISINATIAAVAKVWLWVLYCLHYVNIIVYI